MEGARQWGRILLALVVLSCSTPEARAVTDDNPAPSLHPPGSTLPLNPQPPSHRATNTNPLPALPQLGAAPADLDRVMKQNQDREALTLASLVEEQRQASAARAHQARIAMAKASLCAIADTLRTKLSAALSKSTKLQRAARAMRHESLDGVRKTRLREKHHQKAARLATALKGELLARERDWQVVQDKVIHMDARVHRRAKYRVAQADQAAATLLQQAKLKAAQLRAHARRKAVHELADTKAKEEELSEDARSEVASTKRKVARASLLVAKTAQLMRKAQSKTWGLLAHTQALQDAADTQASLTGHQKAQLQRTQQQLQTVQLSAE